MKILVADISGLDTLPQASADELAEISRVTNEKRRGEMLLTRGLVKQLLGGECRIGHRDDGSPFAVGHDGSLSISHSLGKAVVVYSESATVGVDIEHWREMIRRVVPKFLSDCEIPVYSSSEQLLLRAWTIKEAVYKVMGIKNLSLFAIRLSENPDDEVATVALPDGREVAVRLLFYDCGNPSITVACL